MKKNTILQLKGIRKRFGETTVLSGIDLSIEEGEFITLLGSSGCGKTTTLRIIAGLETPDSGQVILDGADITALEPNKRPVNTVFQNYALFPYMTVADNIGYGLKIRKVPKPDIAAKVEEMLQLVQLESYGSRMPGQLSGGQRQRVAIARALIHDRSILLVDEGTSALDQKNASIVEDSLLANPELTLLLVSHHLSPERRRQFDGVYHLEPAAAGSSEQL